MEPITEPCRTVSPSRSFRDSILPSVAACHWTTCLDLTNTPRAVAESGTRPYTDQALSAANIVASAVRAIQSCLLTSGINSCNRSGDDIRSLTFFREVGRTDSGIQRGYFPRSAVNNQSNLAPARVRVSRV